MRFLLPALVFPMLLTANTFESTLDEEREWLEEETFVVSASRVKEDIKKTAASVTVIDEKMIEIMGANTLLDVLRTVPGLGIHQSQIFVNEIESRGVKTWFSEKVLVLLNGHSLNGLRNGGATLQYDTINLENVERIEVVRGPASALYGENAFTALINIITKKAEDIDGTVASVKLGSYNTQSYNLLFGKKIDDVSIMANLNYVKSDGYKAYVAQDAIGNSGYTDPTTDKKSLNLNVESKGFYFMGQYTDRKEGPQFGAAKALGDRTLFHYESYFVEAGYKKELSDTFSLHTRVYYDNSKADNIVEVFPKGFPAPFFTDGVLAISSAEEEKKGVELLLTYKQDQVTLVSGMMYERQELNNPNEIQNYHPITLAPFPTLVELPEDLRSIAEVDRDVYAFYTELLYDVTDDVRLTLGGRYDHFSDFGDTFSPRGGVTWQANDTNTFKLMYGEAFRAPTFAELYNKNNPVLVGNPNLNPEDIETFELNFINSDIDNTEIKLTLFHNYLSNLITVDGTGHHVNSGNINTKGIEAEMKYNLGRGSFIMANYTYQDPQNETTNAPMPNVSEHKAYMAVNYRFDKTYNLYIDANYRGEQFRSIIDTREEVDSSIVANATLLLKDVFVEDLKLRLSVYNLFDEQVYDSSTPYDYPLAQRSFMAELTYKF
ncbi:MAG: TonB-dependent receptor [Epsilonproteobacteria bacterium]|nr:MAG: TonB-dependent receptor [Campylobacterota bacterium]